MEGTGGWEGSDVVVVGFVHCHVPHACDTADALTTETPAPPSDLMLVMVHVSKSELHERDSRSGWMGTVGDGCRGTWEDWMLKTRSAHTSTELLSAATREKE
jgi:hypothetical protein